MTDRDILIELLAIKLHEHTPLAGGARQIVDWTRLDPAGRQSIRDLIIAHRTAEGLLDELGEE
jgi:hypothetical protein